MAPINKPEHALFISKIDFYNKFGRDFTLQKFSDISDERTMFGRLCTYDYLADSGNNPVKGKEPDGVITYSEYLEFLERHSIYKPAKIEKENAKAIFEVNSVKFFDPDPSAPWRSVVHYAVLSVLEDSQDLRAINGDMISCKPGSWLRFQSQGYLVRTELSTAKKQLINIGNSQYFIQNGKHVNKMICVPGTELAFHDNENAYKFTPAMPFQISVMLTIDGKSEQYIFPCDAGKEVVCWPNGRPRNFFTRNGQFVSLSENGIE